MTFEQRIEWCKEMLDDPTFPLLREYRERHGDAARIVGNFPVWAPQEIVAAAGALPVTIAGAGSTVEIDHADSRVQSFVCSISRSTLELGMRGHLDCLDGMIFTSICDVARNLGGIFKRNFPRIPTFYLHCPQNVASPSALDYFTAELARFRHALEESLGHAITDAALTDSIATFNDHRAALRALYDFRRENPEKISAAEAFLLLRVGVQMPRTEHARLVRETLAEVAQRPVRRRDRIRVLIEGSFCEQPPWDLIATIEEAGCYIVDDDFLLGAQWFEAPVNGRTDPIRALAESYVRHSTSSSVRHYGDRPRAADFARKIERNRVDGVIFCAAKFCEPALYDYVQLKNVAEEKRVPYLTFEFEERMGVFESIQTQVETFVESILLFED